MLTNGRHLGRLGFFSSCMRASCGRRFPFRVLQGMQEQTTFSQVVCPPRSRGRTWSMFRLLRSKRFPQYWHVFLSRSKTFSLVNLTSFFGSRSKRDRTIIRGILILREMVCSILGSGLEIEKSLQLKKSCVKKFLSPSDATACACPW